VRRVGRRGRRVAPPLVVAVALALLATTGQAQSLRALSSAPAASATSVESAAVESFAGPDRTGKDGPLASVGLDLARIHAASAVPGGLAALRADSAVAGAPQVRGDRVLIDATAVASGTDLLRDLEALGLRNGVAYGRVVSGELPIEAIPQAAALTGLKGAAPARAARSVGAVDSQADAAMRADASRLAFGVDGSGVAVGTLSDSYDCSGTATTTAADDVASGDLPAGVVVLEELGTCPGGIDEGRAMMQLIHDVAPGASQLFHTAFGGQAGFAQGIVDLEAAGADVIVDDVFYFAEPMFQDGIIAQAADQVVAAGVPYFSSVGNQADASYEDAFRATPKPAGFAADVSDTVHDFDPGPGVDAVQEIVVEPGATVTLILQWDDPFASAGVGNPGASGDVDLFLTDTAGSTIVAQSVDDNVAGGDPVEIVQVQNGGSAPASAGVVIGFFGGVPPGTVKYAFLGDMSVEEYATNSATGFGHPNAAGAAAVGAACYCDTPEFGQDPPLREAFSSLGGVPILFDVAGNRLATPEQRPKPEITAPDGTDTTFFGFDSDGTGFPNFFGTSAAAPHAAAVAALLLDLAPGSTPAEIYAALESTAIDMAEPGFDPWTGHGLIQADGALLSFAGTVGFAAPSYEAAEGDGAAAITVERIGGSAGAASVDYATSDGTATEGDDYAPTSGTLTWSDGDASPKTIDVPLLDDADAEGNETLALVLSGPIGTAIARADATLTVTEDDPSSLTVAKGPASPGAALRSEPGASVTALQLLLAAPSGAATASIDALSATITTAGSAGAPTDVAQVRLHVDADADGVIDAGSGPVAVAAPNASGDLVLAPTDLTVAAGEELALLVELEFGASLARLPGAAPFAALALPLLFGLAGLRRQRLVGVALLAILIVAACSGPPPRSADVTIEIVAVDSSSTVPGVTVAPSGLPIAGSTVAVTE
jgi:hypothetical protein